MIDKKKIEKQIAGLERQKKLHKKKIDTETGRKDTTHDYWKKEIAEFEKQIKVKIDKLRKMKSK